MAHIREGKFASLRTKVLWTALLLACFIIGRNIPVPLLHTTATGTAASTQLLIAANIATGGNFFYPSVFSLGLGPWMGAAILWRFLFIGQLARDRNIPEETVNRARYAVMVVLAIIQSISLISRYKIGALPWAPLSGQVYAEVVIVLILTAGAVVVAWLANRNEDLGLGGITMFILAQIIITGMQNMEALSTANFSQYAHVLWFVIPACVGVVLIGIFAGNADLRLHVNKVSIDNGFTGLSYLPIKLNPAGASPIMYAFVLLIIPQYIAEATSVVVPSSAAAADRFLAAWGLSTPLGITLHVVLLIGLAIFFGLFTVDPKGTAKRMKDGGEYFDGIAPGPPTRRYIRRRVVTLSAVSGAIIALLTGVPLYFIGSYPNLQYLLLAPGTLMILLGLLWLLQEEIDDTLIGKRYAFSLRAPSRRATA